MSSLFLILLGSLYFYSVLLLLFCVSAATIVAGLTMILFSVEVLQLRIKE